MKKKVYLFPLLTCILIFSQVTSCTKDTPVINPPLPVCDVKGIYSGTSSGPNGAVSSMTYKLQDNNFAIGTVTPAGAAVTFGGYRNTCDSVVISSYYTSNSSYYVLKGKLSNNGTTISGAYNNLTTPSDFGTFSISK